MIQENEKVMRDSKPAWFRTRRWWIFALIGLLLITSLWMWFARDVEGILGHADKIGYAVCHQIDLRSFHIGDRPIPLCARCTGMYLGAALGWVFLSIVNQRRAGVPNWKVIAFFVLLAGTFVIDGGNSVIKLYTGSGLLYEPHNTLRLITGSFMGLGIAVALFPAANQTIWKVVDHSPVLNSIKETGVLLLLNAVVALLVLTENPMILYPLSIISAMAVPALLGIIYTMVFVMLFKAENRIETLKELFVPASLGLIVAVIQIIVINIVRFSLIGGVEHLITG